MNLKFLLKNRKLLSEFSNEENKIAIYGDDDYYHHSNDDIKLNNNEKKLFHIK